MMGKTGLVSLRPPVPLNRNHAIVELGRSMIALRDDSGVRLSALKALLCEVEYFGQAV
jgi:hypothetical protein